MCKKVHFRTVSHDAALLIMMSYSLINHLFFITGKVVCYRSRLRFGFSLEHVFFAMCLLYLIIPNQQETTIRFTHICRLAVSSVTVLDPIYTEYGIDKFFDKYLTKCILNWK